ncbi:MAG: phosphoesterase [Gammaproteobacteria bacterium]|nr:phosphoesterase [Gammaproteobacteria bacterium]
MKITQTVKKVVKPHVDAPSWVDLQFLSKSITSVADMMTGLVVPEKATYHETFEEACVRLNLTEEDLQQRLKQFQRIQWVFISLALLTFAYFLWLIFHAAYNSAVICLAVISVTCSQIFRYNFWAFQVKQRKLGCTFKEWCLHFTQSRS